MSFGTRVVQTKKSWLCCTDAAGAADLSAADSLSTMHGQSMPTGGGAAAVAAGFTSAAPAAEAHAPAEWAFQSTGLSMSAGMAAPQSTHYPSVADLEVAGEELLSLICLTDRHGSHSSICSVLIQTEMAHLTGHPLSCMDKAVEQGRAPVQGHSWS